MKDLDHQFEDITKSQFTQELYTRLTDKIKGINMTPEMLSKLKKASDFSSRFGKFLLENSFTQKTGTLSGLFRLNQYSGTATHETVKTIGHFFGKSFKPWEAVKLGRTAANVGRGFAVAGTILTIGLQIKEDADAAQREKDLREERSRVRSEFNDAAHAIEMHYNKATNSYITSTLTTEIEAVDKKLTELRDMQQARNSLFQGLLDLLEETRCMIRELHIDKNEVI